MFELRLEDLDNVCQREGALVIRVIFVDQVFDSLIIEVTLEAAQQMLQLIGIHGAITILVKQIKGFFTETVVLRRDTLNAASVGCIICGPVSTHI